MAASEPRAPAKNGGPATAADVRVWRPSRKNSGPGGRVRNDHSAPFPHAARSAGDGLSVRRTPTARRLSLSAARYDERAVSPSRREEHGTFLGSDNQLSIFDEVARRVRGRGSRSFAIVGRDCRAAEKNRRPSFVWPEFPELDPMDQGDPQGTEPAVALAAGHSRILARHGSGWRRSCRG